MRVLHTRRHPTDSEDFNPRSSTSLVSGSCCFLEEPFLGICLDNFFCFFVGSTGGSFFLFSAFLVFGGRGKLVLRVSSLGLATSDDTTITELSETSILGDFRVVVTGLCVGSAGFTKGFIYKTRIGNTCFRNMSQIQYFTNMYL